MADLIRAYRKGERPRLQFARHFTERMAAMGVTEDEVFNAIAHPEDITVANAHDAMLLKHGRVALSICLRDSWPVASTVLWRYREEWERAYQDGTAGGAGRDSRDLSLLPSQR
jgi:hypothetical protein